MHDRGDRTAEHGGGGHGTPGPLRQAARVALTRRASGEWSDDEQQGSIDFTDGRATLSCAPGALLLSVQAAPDSVARLEDVVGRHLVRFGARDELVVRWVRADGTAGTERRKQED